MQFLFKSMQDKFILHISIQTFPTLASHVQHKWCYHRDSYSTCITGSIDAVSTSSLLLVKPMSLIKCTCFFFSSLHGIGLLQCWFYFHWYPHDSWRIKSTVCHTFLIISICMLSDTQRPQVLLLAYATRHIKKWHPNSYLNLSLDSWKVSKWQRFSTQCIVTW